MTNSKPIPLIVTLSEELILGKTHTQMVHDHYRTWGGRILYEEHIKDTFRGVVIHAEEGIVDFFCGATAIGEFEYEFIKYSEPLSKRDKLSIYRRFVTAIRTKIKPPKSKRTKKLVFGDHRRPVSNRRLSIWEMGHMVPCIRTSEYTNLGSGNRTKMFIF